MASPNMNMRDPVMYRILHATHPHTGDTWCIYPMYDWAHGLEDSIEGVTHSLCSLEFEDHRPLYDWFLDELGVYHPQQIEFARLNFTYTVMSKRFFRRMIQEGIVRGYDDPRLPTLSGSTPARLSPRKRSSMFVGCWAWPRPIVPSIWLCLEHCVREDLNKRSPRVMGVLRPLRLVIDNYPENQGGRIRGGE